VVIEEPEATYAGVEGYEFKCTERDTIHSVTISKADAWIIFQGDRYEAKVTLHHRFDSIIYISAVNSGFEVFRGTINRDSIIIIDRLNRVVYKTPMERRYGFKHPANFETFETLTSLYGCCRLTDYAHEYGNKNIMFDLSGDFNNRKIYIDRENYKLERFEFVNKRSNEFMLGEREEDGAVRFHSNFIIGEVEIKASGGEIFYNREISVNMEVNKRRYSFIEL